MGYEEDRVNVPRKMTISPAIPALQSELPTSTGLWTRLEMDREVALLLRYVVILPSRVRDELGLERFRELPWRGTTLLRSNGHRRFWSELRHTSFPAQSRLQAGLKAERWRRRVPDP